MLSDIENRLIEDYLNHTLSEPNKQLFLEKWLENGGNNPFAKTLKVMQTIDRILENDPITLARLALYQERANQPTAPDSAAQNQPAQASYSTAELRQMFAPLPEMEQAMTTRSATVVETWQELIMLPFDGINCINSLDFAFAKVVDYSLECIIYNNQGKVEAKQTIPALQTSFEVPLSLPPGRYYWKLNPTDRNLRKQLGHAIGMFLVNADLMEP